VLSFYLTSQVQICCQLFAPLIIKVKKKSKEENKLSGIFCDQTADPLPQRGDCFMLLIYQRATIQQLITKCRGKALME
jgi:hypothetical protein